MIDPIIKQKLEFYLRAHYSKEQKEERLYCRQVNYSIHPSSKKQEEHPPKPKEAENNNSALNEKIPLDDTAPSKETKDDKNPAKTPAAPTPKSAQILAIKKKYNELVPTEYRIMILQLQNYLAAKFIPKTFSKQLLHLIKEKELNEIDVYKAANIDRKLFSKIRRSSYHPSRKTAIALILAAHLSYAEAVALLQLAGYSLSNYEKADVIIEFCITNKIYDLMLVNELLQEYADTSL